MRCHLNQPRAWTGCILLLFLCVNTTSGVDNNGSTDLLKPSNLTPILPLDQVQIGMKGYGLTVFQGIRVEPFRVEVVAVMRKFAPGRGLIWVRCPEPRMQKLGPVQGMSGSPIYLWSQDDEASNQPGQGGKLIGALALGFNGTKDCFVGIQPIEQMRQVSGRADQWAELPQESTELGGDPPADVLQPIRQLIESSGRSPSQNWRARAILRASTQTFGLRRSQTVKMTDLRGTPPPPRLRGQVLPMKLPLVVGSNNVAHALEPALEPLGLLPVSLTDAVTATNRPPGATTDGATVVGIPPPGIQPEDIRLEPGGVLSIPLAFGDLDLSAVGTITEVWPDGRVLAFGHGVFGEGPLAVPMATGYVHFIMPSLAASFKLGGSAVIRGSIVRDEHSAVVGAPVMSFTTSPVEVMVRKSALDSASEYQYRIVHHRRLTPFIAGAVVLQSITAESNLPIQNTLRLHGTARFGGSRLLEIDSTLVNTAGNDLLLELLPILTIMMRNPHESMSLESLRLTADIEPTIRSASIVNALIDRAEIAPGDTIGITIHIQPYGQPIVKKRIVLATPESLADGDYELVVCDAATYTQLLLENRPHLLATTNADDLRDVLQRILNVRADAIYAVLQLPESGLAVGRQEMPQLPSSRRALFDTPTNTITTTYMESIEKIVPLGLVIGGSTQFTVGVRHALAD